MNNNTGDRRDIILTVSGIPDEHIADVNERLARVMSSLILDGREVGLASYVYISEDIEDSM